MTTATPDVLPIEMEAWFSATETEQAPPCEWNVGDPDPRRPPCPESADWTMSVRCVKHSDTNRHLLCTEHKDRMIAVVKNFRGRCSFVISHCEPLR